MGCYKKHLQNITKPIPTNYKEKEVDEKQKNKYRIRYRWFT